MRTMKRRMGAALAVLAMTAGLVLAATLPPGPWLPITNITVTAGDSVSLQWADQSATKDSLGLRLYSAASLESPVSWAAVTPPASQAQRGRANLYKTAETGTTLAAAERQKFFRLHGVPTKITDDNDTPGNPDDDTVIFPGRDGDYDTPEDNVYIRPVNPGEDINENGDVVVHPGPGNGVDVTYNDDNTTVEVEGPAVILSPDGTIIKSGDDKPVTDDDGLYEVKPGDEIIIPGLPPYIVPGDLPGSGPYEYDPTIPGLVSGGEPPYIITIPGGIVIHPSNHPDYPLSGSAIIPGQDGKIGTDDDIIVNSGVWSNGYIVVAGGSVTNIYGGGIVDSDGNSIGIGNGTIIDNNGVIIIGGTVKDDGTVTVGPGGSVWVYIPPADKIGNGPGTYDPSLPGIISDGNPKETILIPSGTTIVDDHTPYVVVPGPDGKTGTDDDVVIKPADLDDVDTGTGIVTIPTSPKGIVYTNDVPLVIPDVNDTLNPPGSFPEGTIVLPDGTIIVPGPDSTDTPRIDDDGKIIVGPGDIIITPPYDNPIVVPEPDGGIYDPTIPGIVIGGNPKETILVPSGTTIVDAEPPYVVVPGPDGKTGTDDDVVIKPADLDDVDTGTGIVTIPTSPEQGIVSTNSVPLVIPDVNDNLNPPGTFPEGTLVLPDGTIIVPKNPPNSNTPKINDDGTVDVGPGDIVIHPPYDAPYVVDHPGGKYDPSIPGVIIGTNPPTVIEFPYAGKITGLAVSTFPKTTYVVGQTFDATDLVVTLTYDTGKTVEVPFADFAQYGIATSPAHGTTLTEAHNGATITVTCNGITKIAGAVTVNAVTVIGISVTTQPSNRSYDAGQSLSLDGLVVTLTYNSGATADVPYAQFGTYAVTANPANGTSLTVAAHHNKPVVVSVGNYSADTENLTVTAPAPVITYENGSFIVEHNASYSGAQRTVGTASVTGGGTITYAITNGQLPAGLSLNANNGNITGTVNVSNLANSRSVIVRATSGTQTQDATWTITVQPVLTYNATALESVVTGVNKTYDLTAATVTGNGEITYSRVDSGGLPPASTFGTSDYGKIVRLIFHDNPATPPGTYYLTVRATSGGVTKDAIWTFVVTAAAKVVSHISVKDPPTRLNYASGDNLSLVGFVVTLRYSDGSSLDVPYNSFDTYDITASPANGTALTTANNGNPITVSANGYSAVTANLTVTAPPVITYTTGDTLASVHTDVAKTYQLGGATVTGSGTITYAIQNMPSKASFNINTGILTFRTGSNATPTGTYTFTTTASSPGAATKTATWTITVTAAPVTTVTLTYHLNGASGTPPVTQTVNQGASATVSSTVPTRTGYDFLGWATRSDATSAQYASGSSITMNDNTTLYAVWKTSHVPVTDITGVPTTMETGTPLTLSGTVEPTDATNKSISWTVANVNGTGATIAGNTLTATAAGTVRIRATIANGVAVGANFTQEFDIVVTAATDPTAWNGAGHILQIDLDTYVATKLAANAATPANANAIYLRYINAGGFAMGSPTTEYGRANGTRENQKNVTLTSGYYIGVYPVTVAQYQKVMASGTSSSAAPQAAISYTMLRGAASSSTSVAVANQNSNSFLERLTAKVRANNSGDIAFDLPTEAQWEFACRAGTTGSYSDGAGASTTAAQLQERIKNIGWNTDNNSPTGVKTVGQKAANRAGLYDMHGNVHEWCRDAWNGTADLIGGTNPRSDAGGYRIARGGNYSSTAANCRSANRGGNHSAGDTNVGVGFRLCASGDINQTAPANNGWNGVDHTIKIDLNTYTVTKLAANAGSAVEANAIYLRYVNAGGFAMGSPTTESGRANGTRENQKNVTLTGYYIGVHPVTVAQYQKVMASGTSSSAASQAGISYTMLRGAASSSTAVAVANQNSNSFLERLTAKVRANNSGNIAFDLPTEAQWEFACRAGTTGSVNDGAGISTTSDHLNDRLGVIAWWNGNNSPTGVKTVGQKAANRAGLYDMHGNVNEWCRDAWNGTADLIGGTNPRSDAGSFRIARGGNYSSTAAVCRSAHRGGNNNAGDTNVGVGFRLGASGSVQ